MNNLNNISEEQLNAIDRYLDNEMSVNERVEFDKKLNEDSILGNLVSQVQELRLGVESAVLEEQLNDFHEDMVPVRTLDTSPNTSSNKSLLRRLMPLSIAASVVAAIGIFMFMNQGSANDKLFAKHFKADPGLPTVMSSTDQYEFYDAMVDYKREKYKDAIEKWETLLSNKPNNDTLNYFLGVAELANRNETGAIKYFKEALKNNESVFSSETHFYLGLAHLKANNIKAAKVSLSKSSLPESQLILQEINK